MVTHGEKIDELFKLAHTLTERVDGLREELRAVRPDVVKVNDAAAALSTSVALLKQELVALQAWKDQLGVTEIKAEVTVLKEHTRTVRELVDKASQGDPKSEVTLLKDQVKKLQEAAEKRGNRAWSIVPNLVGAVVSGLIAALVAYLLRPQTRQAHGERQTGYSPAGPAIRSLLTSVTISSTAASIRAGVKTSRPEGLGASRKRLRGVDGVHQRSGSASWAEFWAIAPRAMLPITLLSSMHFRNRATW